MDAKQVGERLVELCQDGRTFDAINELYADDVVSLEAAENANFKGELRGKEAVIGKNKWWFENNEIHAASAEGPYMHKDRFAVKYHFDFTRKTEPMLGQRVDFHEVAVYTVKNGKIVREEFFYNM